MWSVSVKMKNGFTDIMFIFNIFGRVWCSPMADIVYIIHLLRARRKFQFVVFISYILLLNTYSFIWLHFFVSTAVCQFLSCLIRPE